jgi:hypothetical protein
MRWWPVRAIRRRPPALPPMLPAPTVTPPPSPPLALGSQPVPPAERQSFERPHNVVGLLSDLFRFRQQSVNAIILVGGILVVGTACLICGVWVIAEATRGLKFGALPAVLAGGASILGFVASRIKRWFKKPPDSGKDGSSGG